MRNQINFRIDNELLEAIKAKCASDGITVTDFFTDAARTALGMETMNRTTHPSSDALESLVARLDEVEARLAEGLASREKVDRIDAWLEEVVGEIAA